MNLTDMSATARYDQALKKARDHQLPTGYHAPQPTSVWPRENVALLEAYRQWLLTSGTSPFVVAQLYIPMAGHVLGLNLKPHTELNLDTDLTPALEYVQAKQLSAEWLNMSRCALLKFQQFLRQQRGQQSITFREPDLSAYTAHLGTWLIETLSRYQHLRQANWRPNRVAELTLQFWSHHARVWRWLCEHYDLNSLDDLRRSHVLAYVDQRLAQGYAPNGINQDLRALHAFLLFLQDQDWRVPQALLRIPALKEPDRLPRFLSDAQVGVLRDAVEQRVTQAQSSAQRRDALLDRATFYLLWQTGLRLGEVEELRLDDLDLPDKKLMVRQGKGRKDRAVYLTETVVQVLAAYLSVRGQGSSDHVFLYRAESLRKDLIRERLKAAGKRVGVKVSPHALRHTFGTQLLNAGCKVTSIQKLMGHRRLNSTLVYARVHDHTVAVDYYAAMDRIEKAMQVVPRSDDTIEPMGDDGCLRTQLLVLVNRLAEPQLACAVRRDAAEQLRVLLNSAVIEPVVARLVLHSCGP